MRQSDVHLILTLYLKGKIFIDAYVLAVNEMLEKTSTKDAPWIVVEGNSKWYARIKVLETVADAMEKKIKEVEKNRKR